MNPKHRQKIRLDSEIYRTPNLPCFVTITTKGKQAIFSHRNVAQNFVALLRIICKENSIPLYAYCVMPDHVHLLVSASETKGIIEFVRETKSLSTRLAWQHGYKGPIWQRSFYDHFLRRDEDCMLVAKYIVGNPVRKGIVEHWQDYPFSGSLVYEL
ncbi:MAG: transposase [Dehalococcoidia bacterium]|jgi:putative transposase